MSVATACLRAEIWTGDLPNTKQEWLAFRLLHHLLYSFVQSNLQIRDLWSCHSASYPNISNLWYFGPSIHVVFDAVLRIQRGGALGSRQTWLLAANGMRFKGDSVITSKRKVGQEERKSCIYIYIYIERERERDCMCVCACAGAGEGKPKSWQTLTDGKTEISLAAAEQSLQESSAERPPAKVLICGLIHKRKLF
jgi:hypothetical protein